MFKIASHFTTWALENNASSELDNIGNFLLQLAHGDSEVQDPDVTENEAQSLRFSGGDVADNTKDYVAMRLYHVLDSGIREIAKQMFDTSDTESINRYLFVMLRMLGNDSRLGKKERNLINNYFEEYDSPQPVRQRVVRRMREAMIRTELFLKCT